MSFSLEKIPLTARVLFGLVSIEALSLLVVFHPTINGIVALMLALGVFVWTVFRPEWGLLVLGLELIVGSKGGLFRWQGDLQGNGGVSIRILLFIAVLLAWMVYAIRFRTWQHWPLYVQGRKKYLALAALVGYAFLRGIALKQPFVVADANAWGMWLLLLPVIDIAYHRAEALKQLAWPVLRAALLWVPIKTLFLFYYFSHSFSPGAIETVYLWVRRTGVGEITRASGSAFRIFFQSHIYALGVVLFLWLKRGIGRTWSRSEWVLVSLSLAEILVSLSRSLWIGMFVGVIGLFLWALVRSRRHVWTLLQAMVISGLVAITLTAGLLWVPLPPSDASLTSLIRTRVGAGDDAAMSR